MFPEPRTVAKIFLSWEFPPQRYEILFYSTGLAWDNFMKVDATKADLIAEFSPRMVMGVMLKMELYDIKKS